MGSHWLCVGAATSPVWPSALCGAACLASSQKRSNLRVSARSGSSSWMPSSLLASPPWAAVSEEYASTSLRSKEYCTILYVSPTELFNVCLTHRPLTWGIVLEEVKLFCRCGNRSPKVISKCMFCKLQEHYIQCLETCIICSCTLGFMKTHSK